MSESQIDFRQTKFLISAPDIAHLDEYLSGDVGVEIAFAGRPNAGKSSLLNLLAGDDLAIVNQRAGTTRDILREDIQIDGLPLRIIDTAGLRDSDDEIEQEGIRRAKKEIENRYRYKSEGWEPRSVNNILNINIE